MSDDQGNGTRARAGGRRPDHEVAIIGAGFAGLGAGMMLRRAGIEDFVILERADAIGGTWRDNVYPGVAVDVPSLTYQFSFELNPDWSRLFAPGAEVRAYAERCADRYDLWPRIRLGVEVTRVTFDEEQGLWRLRLGRRSLTARFVICALGGLKQPKLPQIPGLEDFGGDTLHTAQWEPGLDVAGKRVGVIGTGATSVQLVPRVAPRASHTTVFQRTPIWVLPKLDVDVPSLARIAYRRVPPVQNAARLSVTALVEVLMTLGVVYNRELSGLVRGVERLGRWWLHKQVDDPRVRRQLTPAYGFGCKRPTMSNDYLRTFNRSDCQLVTDPIDRVTPAGVLCADGTEHRLDTLILATGFLLSEPENMPSVPVFGRGGRALREFWREHRLQAYEGTTIPGFPNLFTIFGPYALIGSSWMFMIEYQVTHAIRVIRETRRRRAATAEVRPSANERYFAEVQRRMPSTVFFNNHCESANSYYFDERGDAPFLRPSTMFEAWWRARHFDLNDYHYGAASSPAA